MENILADLAPEELAALLSVRMNYNIWKGFVCQWKNSKFGELEEFDVYKLDLPETLIDAIIKTQTVVGKII